MADYKYTNIKNAISQKIKTGEYTQSMPIPSERQLTEQYDCSRMTVRQAISSLVSNGILYRQQGKGTFVSTDKFSQNSVMSFTRAISQKGKTPNTIVVCFEKKPLTTVPSISFDFGDKQYFISKRIRLADKTPIAIETVYIPFENCPTLKEEMLRGSLHSTLSEKYNLAPISCEFTISAMICNDYEANTLKIPKSSAILNIISKYYSEKGKLIYIESAVYRGDMYEYRIKSKQIISD